MAEDSWAIVSLNGDHPVGHIFEDDPNPGPNEWLSDTGNLTSAGLGKMDDGRVLAQMQNLRSSPGGYKWSWADAGDVPYLTSRFVTGPGEVGPYAIIWDGDDHYPHTYTGPRYGTHTYYWSTFDYSYHQTLPMGDYAVVAFQHAADPQSGSGAPATHAGWLARFDILLLDVTGDQPVVVDSDTLFMEFGGSGSYDTTMNEPDIGKVADDVFVLFDNPRVGGSRRWEITAYRVGPGGFTKGAMTVDSGGHSYSGGIAGVDGEFMVSMPDSPNGEATAAWLGTVNLVTLEVTKDAIAAIPDQPDPSGYSASRWSGQADVNIAGTVRLPEPRIGLVTANYWADMFEIERVGDTVQVAGAFSGVAKGSSDHAVYFHFDLGRSWPVAWDTQGKAHTFYMRWVHSTDQWEFTHAIDIFGTPILEIITDETWADTVGQELWVIADEGFYASMDLVFANGVGYLQIHGPSSETYVGEEYDFGHYGMQKNPPWGQYYCITFGAGEIKGGPVGDRHRWKAW